MTGQAPALSPAWSAGGRAASPDSIAVRAWAGSCRPAFTSRTAARMMSASAAGNSPMCSATIRPRASVKTVNGRPTARPRRPRRRRARPARRSAAGNRSSSRWHRRAPCRGSRRRCRPPGSFPRHGPCASCLSSGISRRQGAHQVAQKLTIRALPCQSSRSERITPSLVRELECEGSSTQAPGGPIRPERGPGPWRASTRPSWSWPRALRADSRRRRRRGWRRRWRP